MYYYFTARKSRCFLFVTNLYVRSWKWTHAWTCSVKSSRSVRFFGCCCILSLHCLHDELSRIHSSSTKSRRTHMRANVYTDTASCKSGTFIFSKLCIQWNSTKSNCHVSTAFTRLTVFLHAFTISPYMLIFSMWSFSIYFLKYRSGTHFFSYID